MSFEEYLKEQGFKPDTIYQHRKYASCFLAWLSIENVSLVQVSYNDILDYADHQKKENNSVNLINRMLLTIRYYFTYLQKEDQLNHNPAAGISLKGSIRTVPGDLLEKAELEHLYADESIQRQLKTALSGLQEVVIAATQNGIAIPAYGSVLTYFNSMRTGRMPSNLIQAQRDFFGAHTFERTDEEGTFHAIWNSITL